MQMFDKQNKIEDKVFEEIKAGKWEKITDTELYLPEKVTAYLSPNGKIALSAWDKDAFFNWHYYVFESKKILLKARKQIIDYIKEKREEEKAARQKKMMEDNIDHLQYLLSD